MYPGDMGHRSLTDPEPLERSREWQCDSLALSKCAEAIQAHIPVAPYTTDSVGRRQKCPCPSPSQEPRGWLLRLHVVGVSPTR